MNPQCLAWIKDETLPKGRVLVPGAGRSAEPLALAQAGYAVTVVDVAESAVAFQAGLLAPFGGVAVKADLFAWAPDVALDAVYEQTCLCAMHPDHWTRYARALHDWLRPGGRLFLMGMQVSRPAAADGVIEGPPYNVPVNALRALFDGSRWEWPAPPYPRVAHPFADAYELGLVLVRR